MHEVPIAFNPMVRGPKMLLALLVLRYHMARVHFEAKMAQLGWRRLRVSAFLLAKNRSSLKSCLTGWALGAWLCGLRPDTQHMATGTTTPTNHHPDSHSLLRPSLLLLLLLLSRLLLPFDFSRFWLSVPRASPASLALCFFFTCNHSSVPLLLILSISLVVRIRLSALSIEIRACHARMNSIELSFALRFAACPQFRYLPLWLLRFLPFPIPLNPSSPQSYILFTSSQLRTCTLYFDEPSFSFFLSLLPLVLSARRPLLRETSSGLFANEAPTARHPNEYAKPTRVPHRNYPPRRFSSLPLAVPYHWALLSFPPSSTRYLVGENDVFSSQLCSESWVPKRVRRCHTEPRVHSYFRLPKSRFE